jgi:hypothetical protein
VGISRLVGFEELGNEDVFDTATLELRLSMCGEHKSQICCRGIAIDTHCA